MLSIPANKETGVPTRACRHRIARKMMKVAPFDQHTQEYDEWFERNHFAYLSELQAIGKQLPADGESLEIGVGTGRFAAPLNITAGLEPSIRMREMARDRGITVVGGVGEWLPFRDASFDVALMVTTVCFLDDVARGFAESHRILRNNGCLIVGFIDKDSPLGQQYHEQSEENPFYRFARFYSADEVTHFLRTAGFRELTSVQTIFRKLTEITQIEPVKGGYGEGSFVVIKGLK